MYQDMPPRPRIRGADLLHFTGVDGPEGPQELQFVQELRFVQELQSKTIHLSNHLTLSSSPKHLELMASGSS